MNMVTKKKYEKTKFFSHKTGKLCEGCKLCVKGKKLVLFITGLCPRKCFYCPISEDKYGQDVGFANEWKISNLNNPLELLEEAKLTDAKGAGITGGDPLVKINRTCEYIQLLKKEFGKNFHIHLYTSLDLVSEINLRKLHEAGLDEIRFHPSFKDQIHWNKINLAKKFSWSVGVEIPVVPGLEKETKKLIKFLKNKVDFINFNELEFSDTNLKHYSLKGFNKKNDSSYAVKGSEELGFELLNLCSDLDINAHLCSAKLKNAIQVGERLKRRANNVALPTDEITEECLLLRGVIYLKGLEPGFEYEKRTKKVDSEIFLLTIKEHLLKTKKFEEEDLFLDKDRHRILTHVSLVEKHKELIKKLNCAPCISEEHPSSDFFCVDLEFL